MRVFTENGAYMISIELNAPDIEVLRRSRADVITLSLLHRNNYVHIIGCIGLISSTLVWWAMA